MEKNIGDVHAGLVENILRKVLPFLYPRNYELETKLSRKKSQVNINNLESTLSGLLEDGIPLGGFGGGHRIPTDDDLMESWRGNHPQTLYSRGNFLRYSNGVWQCLVNDSVRQEILLVLKEAKRDGFRPNAARLTSVMNLAQAELWVHNNSWDTNMDIIVFQNGVFDLQTGQLRPHSPNDRVTYCLPYAYDPDARCPAFETSLSIYTSEVISFLQEYVGYCLTPDTRHELALWLFGPPGSGKSTFIEGVKAMLGRMAGPLGLRQIQNSKFALSNLPGKTVVFSTEQPTNVSDVTDVLNKMISGEELEVEEKYKPPYSFRPTAKIIWAMNEEPKSFSPENGIFRRLAIVESSALDPEKKNVNLKEQIAREGPGIMNWGLEGLQRLRSRGRFEFPVSILAANARFRSLNDIPSQFVEECCEKGENFKVQAMAVYTAYRTWCTQSGFKPLNTKQLAGHWRRLGFWSSESDGKRYWHGLRLKQ